MIRTITARPSRSRRPHALLVAALLVAGLLPAPALIAQNVVIHTTDPVIIAPQSSSVVIHPLPHPPQPPPHTAPPHHRPPRRPPPPPGPVTVTTVASQVSIDDQVGTTTLVMTLHNPGHTQREAQVLVPVPEGVSIRSFGIDGMGPEPTAKLLPRDEARRIYEGIVRRSLDPGLLEFVGYSLIRSSVFPVPPGGTQTVRLTYEALLPAERGSGENGADRIDYILPRSEGLAGTGVQWTMSVDLRARRPISTVYSPSHEIALERISEKHIRVKTTASAGAAAGSFRMSYLLTPEKDGLSATVLAYPDAEVGEGGYFMLLAGLPARSADDAKKVKREVTVVIDRSGSMRGEKMKQAREAAVQVLEGLLDGERFNIVDYSDSIASFEDKPVVKDEESMRRAREYLKGIQANGGTNIHDALIEALRPAPTPGMLPVVLFLTDGLPTVGQTGEAAIREAAKKANTGERRIFTFGVGFDVNGPLLTGIARATRATSTFVLPEEDVEVKVGQVFRKLSGPVMAAPKLALASRGEQGGSRLRELQPGELPDLFDGDQLVVLGQYTGKEPVTMRIAGSYLGKDQTFEVKFDPTAATVKNAYVGRLWATRKIASLLEEIRLAGANPSSGTAPGDPRLKELVDEIVRLSTRWGILTEYTAFLALEPGSDLAAAHREFAPPAAAAPGAPARRAAMSKVTENVRLRAQDARAGQSAVSQEMNLSYQIDAKCLDEANVFWTRDMKRVQLDGLCQVQDKALFRRAGRWVDSALIHAEQEPEATIEFASDEYFRLCDDLVKQNRQGILAQRGDLYLVHNNLRTLVKGAE
ncbi:MAG: VIT domain-containing protein [Phycisphaerales bacterium]